ncbi:MAG: Vitamin B12 dependent methionine synthase activation subunit, partial [Firmicutes bacterium]|nr:Vitamin B12 dependent methionine synthase activation subunit [Bacillota bacterium]
MDSRVRREALRYAGMGRAADSEVDPRILEFLERAFAELNRVCRPRFTRKIFSLSASDGSLHFGGALDVTSRSLTVNL